MAIAKRCAPDAEEDPWDAHSSIMTWASSILLAIIFLIVLGVSTIWLTVHPRQLQFAVEDVLVSNFKPNNNRSRLVTANFSIKMSTNNSNHRVTFTYESMNVSVKIRDQILASANGPPLFHDKDKFKEFWVYLTSNNVELHGSTLKDWKETGFEDIKINVIIQARVKFKALHWKQDHCRIQIFCGEVEAHSPGKAFKQTNCDVEL
ncbi:NDR1/HIN1-like protein 2 [Eucalyptus grandis]|uniref:NDR1/HIN1-like protein 2 n=1 Tax=Eucalyptus grandis TaxID=71139 RepID=UPI00192EFBEC|nr:NDR1/HIN1-like protein 2 [Eucalyptus grandis]